jgi:hypothetical protein
VVSRRGGVRVPRGQQAMRHTDTGRKFLAYVATVPLTLLTLANLVVAWQAHGPRQHWWLGAAVLMLVERIGTFSYSRE